jgi:hypothetical protein
MSLLLKVVAEVIDPVMASFELDRVQGQNKFDSAIHAQTEVATHYFWIADYTSM